MDTKGRQTSYRRPLMLAFLLQRAGKVKKALSYGGCFREQDLPNTGPQSNNQHYQRAAGCTGSASCVYQKHKLWSKYTSAV